MPRSTRSLMILTFSYAWISVVLPAVIAEDSVTIETICQAWHQRQDRVKTARVAWTMKKLLTKGSMPIGQGIEPAMDTWIEARSALTLDGDKIRYEIDGQTWSHEKKTAVPTAYTSVFDGTIAKTFHAATAEGETPQGDVGPIGTYLDYRFSPIVILNSTLRGVHPLYRMFDREDLKIGRQNVPINGIRCVELIIQENDAPASNYAYVDPARQYVVVRQVKISNNRVVSKTDITYCADSTIGWRPESWEQVVSVAGPEHGKTMKCIVSAFTLNESIPNRDFDIRFPPNARIIDLATQRTIVPGVPSLLWRVRSQWWVTLSAFAIALLCLYILLHRRSRRRKQLSPMSGESN